MSELSPQEKAAVIQETLAKISVEIPLLIEEHPESGFSKQILIYAFELFCLKTDEEYLVLSANEYSGSIFNRKKNKLTTLQDELQQKINHSLVRLRQQIANRKEAKTARSAPPLFELLVGFTTSFARAERESFIVGYYNVLKYVRERAPEKWQNILEQARHTTPSQSDLTFQHLNLLTLSELKQIFKPQHAAKGLSKIFFLIYLLNFPSTNLSIGTFDSLAHQTLSSEQMLDDQDTRTLVFEEAQRNTPLKADLE